MASNVFIRSARLLSSPVPSLSLTTSLAHLRTIRYQAHDALLDQDSLEAARKWHASFNENALPDGQTSYSRSSGPGGQHVNKTETKATTVWSVAELSKGLPEVISRALKSSRYYTARTDSITVQAQTQRSRAANTDENRQKLIAELHRIYQEQVPAATSVQKIKKHEAIAKSFHQSRLNAKKQQSSKKASRRGAGRDD
ncbi:hypothetical protein GGR50DRAFT_34203 [Xylaria sp. CBS 124048]|nr:hypothetical protein GGR50DRAFT_34203 [Xylaria sp. CBS 124048]